MMRGSLSITDMVMVMVGGLLPFIVLYIRMPVTQVWGGIILRIQLVMDM